MTTITLVIEALTACAIAFILTNISIEDCRTFKIRNCWTLAVALAAFLYRLSLQTRMLSAGDFSDLTVTFGPAIEGLIGMLSVALPMLLTEHFFHLTVGGGDIKLMAGLGMYLGWQGSVCVLMISNIAAVLVYAVRKMALKRDVNLKTHIPMGIYIQIGYTVVILWRLAELTF